MTTANHPMAPLHNTPQWIVVLLVPLPNGKTAKIPCDHRTLATHVDAHNPEQWTTYENALAIAAPLGKQFTVGFVLTEADPFWAIDIDNALQPDGTWSKLSHDLCHALPNTSVELSQSKRGLHIWGQGPVPPHTMKRVDLGIELYTELRFIAIGTQATGDMTLPCPTIAAVAAQYFPPRSVAATAAPSNGPRADWRGPTDDEELLRRAMQSKSQAAAFGGKASFADLFTADAAVLARAYPPDSSSTDPYDRSSADAALAAHLCFWTGADRDRVERLMRKSALARDKWDGHATYLVERTITTACGQQRDVLQDKLPEPGPGASAPAGAPSMTAVEGSTFLSPAEQTALFAGCIYVVDAHKVLIPGGDLRRPDQFKAVFGGYTFAMDARNERTSRNAFEAFTESQVLKCPQVDGTCFRPDLPYGAIVENEGRKRANVWWPAHVRRTKGDIEPFLRHLKLLLPDEYERKCFLYFMAHVVQHPGVKAQFFPLLIGVEGNGKTFFSKCVAAAVGQRYTHWVAADKLGGKFNEWLFAKIFYAIEDLKIGDSGEVWEKLKPMITGENIEIEGKGVDQRSDEIYGNFIANSNHFKAVRATANDRRVLHLHCAQQEFDDLARDGITQEYVSGLYGWAKVDGYAIVAEYLHTLAIPPEFGLSWFLGRAPKTRSTAAALVHSLGRVEQEIMDAVEQHMPGFAGGWISSVAVNNLIDAKRLVREAPPLRERHVLIQRLGYVQHPGLASTDGQVCTVVAPDGKRPRLYVRPDHLELALQRPSDIARAYTVAQTAK